MALLIAPTAAFGQGSDPTATEYDPKDKQVSGAADSGNNSDGGSGLNAEVAGLPFTGVDLLIVAGAGAALLGTGIVIRRLSTAGEPRS